MTKHSIFMATKKILLIDAVINIIVDRAAKKHGWVYADKLNDKLYAPITKMYSKFTNKEI